MLELMVKPDVVVIGHSSGDFYKLSVDDIRWLYYGVLGLDFPEGILSDEIRSITPGAKVSVDLPEDVLKVEHVLTLNGMVSSLMERMGNGGSIGE